VCVPLGGWECACVCVYVCMGGGGGWRGVKRVSLFLSWMRNAQYICLNIYYINVCMSRCGDGNICVCVGVWVRMGGGAGGGRRVLKRAQGTLAVCIPQKSPIYPQNSTTHLQKSPMYIHVKSPSYLQKSPTNPQKCREHLLCVFLCEDGSTCVCVCVCVCVFREGLGL